MVILSPSHQSNTLTYDILTRVRPTTALKIAFQGRQHKNGAQYLNNIASPPPQRILVWVCESDEMEMWTFYLLRLTG